MEELKFESLKGKTIFRIDVDDDKECIKFVCDDGKTYQLIYHHDCCASCSIEDICGDLEDLIGNPLLVAEEVDNIEAPPLEGTSKYDSYTWVFYKLDTIKGGVVIRWFGVSNGYYSERATFEHYTHDRGWTKWIQ